MPRRGLVGMCVLNVVVPNTVMAEVTTCSWSEAEVPALGVRGEVSRDRIGVSPVIASSESRQIDVGAVPHSSVSHCGPSAVLRS